MLHTLNRGLKSVVTECVNLRIGLRLATWLWASDLTASQSQFPLLQSAKKYLSHMLIARIQQDNVVKHSTMFGK